MKKTKTPIKVTPIIICNNCGAKYNATEKSCPYCGFENKGLAETEFAQEIETKQDAIRLEKTKPQRFVAAFKKKTFWIVIICIVLIGGLFAIGLVNDTNKPKTYEITEEYLDELETARINHDYQTIKDLIYEKELYGGKYRGYSNLSSVYGEYKYHKQRIEDARFDIEEETFFAEDTRQLSSGIDIAWSIHYGLRAIRSANEILAQDTAYGTEEDILQLREEIVTRFAYWGIDEELITQLTEEMESDHDAVANENSLIWTNAERITKDIMSGNLSLEE